MSTRLAMVAPSRSVIGAKRMSSENLASWVHHREHRGHREYGSGRRSDPKSEPPAFPGSVCSVLSVVEKHSALATEATIFRARTRLMPMPVGVACCGLLFWSCTC